MESIPDAAAPVVAIDADDRLLRAVDPLIRSIPRWEKWRFDASTQQDVTQQIRIEVARAIGSLSDPARRDALVKRIAVRRCIDEVRRQVRERKWVIPLKPDDAGCAELPDVAAPSAFDPVVAIVASERTRLLGELLDQVGESCRSAILDFYAGGLSYREIALKNGITTNTVGSRLSKCLEKLRGLIRLNPELREELGATNDVYRRSNS